MKFQARSVYSRFVNDITGVDFFQKNGSVYMRFSSPDGPVLLWYYPFDTRQVSFIIPVLRVYSQDGFKAPVKTEHSLCFPVRFASGQGGAVVRRFQRTY